MEHRSGLKTLWTISVLVLGLCTVLVQGQGRDKVEDQVPNHVLSANWETRQAYELTHLNTWHDFRPSVQRAIAGYEAYERGITEIVHLPNEPSVIEGGYYRRPVLVTVDEANEIIRTIISYRYEHTEGDIIYYWLPWDEDGYGYGDGWSGASAIHHTGVGLAYVLAKYRHLIPDDLERDLNETVGRLDWFGDESLHPYMSYSNIPVAGACGMLLAGDYVEPDPERGLSQDFIAELRADGYAWFDRMYEEVKRFGYYEILSSYTGVQHISLPAVYEMAKELSARQKARFMLDELYLHLAHLYQPGKINSISYESSGNLAGFHDRSYSHIVTGRPNGHVMWLLTGDSGGELMVDWWPYATLVASGYEPPEFVAGIALKEERIDYQVEQTFWSAGSQATLAFEPHLPDLPQWAGTGIERHLLIPHHVYMIADGSLALGGTIAHIYSSRTGSHNLRLSFSRTDPPLAITQLDPEEASTDPDYPLELAFKNEQPSFRRLFHKNVVLSVWDPMEEGFNYTNVFIPITGTERVEHRGRWFFVRNEGAFVAYAVLADPQEEVSVEIKDGFGKGSEWHQGPFYYVTTPEGALAAGVGEVSSASDYSSFEDFMMNVEGRPLDLDSDSGRLSYVTSDGTPIVVQYSPEQYEINGEIKHREDFYPQYFIQSPWAEHRIPISEQDQFITEVSWNNKQWQYDWKTLEITVTQALTKDVWPTTANYADSVTYTFAFSGRGQPLTLTDGLPDGLSDPIASHATTGTLVYSTSERSITWNGDPPSDTLVQITVPVTVTTHEPRFLINTALLICDMCNRGVVVSDTVTLFVNPLAVYLPVVLRR